MQIKTCGKNGKMARYPFTQNQYLSNNAIIYLKQSIEIAAILNKLNQRVPGNPVSSLNHKRVNLFRLQ